VQLTTNKDLLWTGSTRIISAAVTHMPWRGADSKPLQDVSEFAEYMDFVNIMSVILPVTVFFLMTLQEL